MTKLIDSPEWNAVKQHHKEIAGKFCMKEAFIRDPNRFDKFSVTLGDLLFDYSKNLITEKTLPLLIALAERADLSNKTEAMFSGSIINTPEKRAVLHTALRNRSNKPVFFRGQDVMPEINNVLAKMRAFTEQVRSGEWKGFSGKAITDVVNIGIGGSDLGPKMVDTALSAYGMDTLKTHFVSNVDETDIVETLRHLNPETTLFLISSKTAYEFTLMSTSKRMPLICSSSAAFLMLESISFNPKARGPSGSPSAPKLKEFLSVRSGTS